MQSTADVPDKGAVVHPNLVSLSPKFNEADHGIYLAALEDAIKKGSESKNVALTGAYGTGKSSVLVELARKHPNRITMVSLSSLGSAEDEEAGASSDGTAAKTTNQIQKEIVKQCSTARPHGGLVSRTCVASCAVHAGRTRSSLPSSVSSYLAS